MQLKHAVRVFLLRLLRALTRKSDGVAWDKELAARKSELAFTGRPYEPEVLARELPRYVARQDVSGQRNLRRRRGNFRKTRVPRRPRVDVRIDIDIS